MCANSPCLNAGTCQQVNCTSTSAAYECSCVSSGYKPQYNCNPYSVDVCGSSPCQNGGTCVTETPSDTTILENYRYDCKCAQDWFGSVCESHDTIDDCTKPHAFCCSKGGICVDGFHSTSCKCNNGFSGQDCAADDSGVQYTNLTAGGPNGELPCANAMTSSIPVDPCASKPCGTHTGGNGAQWDNAAPGGCLANTAPPTLGNYSCTCSVQLGYTATTDGKHCCQDPNQCINGIPVFTWLATKVKATDMSGNDIMTQCGMTCQCTAGYGGTLCDTVAPCPVGAGDPCTSSPCQNAGTCLCQGAAGGASYSCQCDIGYTGDVCDTRTNICNDMGVDQCQPANPCQNGGTCHDKCASFKCDCTTSYQGATCQYSRVYDSDPCSSSPCVNGGVCSLAFATASNNYASYQCTCTDNDAILGKDFFGPLCQGGAMNSLGCRPFAFRAPVPVPPRATGRRPSSSAMRLI